MKRIRHSAAALAILLGAAGLGHAVAATTDAMAERLKACAACHGDAGRSAAEGYYPSIAGKPAGYLRQQLLNFREGRREHRVMQQLLAYLSDDYLAAIAGYYAAQAPAPAAASPAVAAAVLERGRALVVQGDHARQVPACSACHGAQLQGLPPAIPGLAGLRADYLQAQLGAWRSGVRRAVAPDCMAQIAHALDAAEIAAVAAWIASQPVPEKATVPAGPAAALPLECGGVQ